MKVLAVYRLAAVLLLVAPSLAAAAPSPAGAVAIEQAVVDAVNVARRESGLTPLAADPRLTEIARGHSCAIAGGGFFDHAAPDGTTMGDRLRAAGVQYRSAGENIAHIQSRGDPAVRAVTGWLRSPSHRENILSPRFTATGVGVCQVGRAFYFTQLFLRPR